MAAADRYLNHLHPPGLDNAYIFIRKTPDDSFSAGQKILVRDSIVKSPQVFTLILAVHWSMISRSCWLRIPQKICQFLGIDPNQSNVKLQSLDVDIFGDRVHLFDLDLRSWPTDLDKVFITLDGKASSRGRLQNSEASKESEREGGRKRRRVGETVVKEEPAQE
jgi:hypothetical protein